MAGGGTLMLSFVAEFLHNKGLDATEIATLVIRAPGSRRFEAWKS
jgi:hypothetical protein